MSVFACWPVRRAAATVIRPRPHRPRGLRRAALGKTAVGGSMLVCAALPIALLLEPDDDAAPPVPVAVAPICIDAQPIAGGGLFLPAQGAPVRVPEPGSEMIRAASEARSDG